MPRSSAGATWSPRLHRLPTGNATGVTPPAFKSINLPKIVDNSSRPNPNARSLRLPSMIIAPQPPASLQIQGKAVRFAPSPPRPARIARRPTLLRSHDEDPKPVVLPCSSPATESERRERSAFFDERHISQDSEWQQVKGRRKARRVLQPTLPYPRAKNDSDHLSVHAPPPKNLWSVFKPPGTRPTHSPL